MSSDGGDLQPLEAIEPLDGEGPAPGTVEGVPDVGAILKRLRIRHNLSLRELSEGSGVSASFLSAVERGTSDISIGRLAQLARFFGLDVGSLLGYSAGRARPHFIVDEDRLQVDRGKGIDYEVLRIGGVGLELIKIEFAPHTTFAEDLTHEGVDIVLVTSGHLIATVAGVDYPMAAGQCAVWSGAYPHRLRNDRDEPASAISIVTESVF